MTECAACGSAELRDNWQWDGVHLWQCKDCTARFSEAPKDCGLNTTGLQRDTYPPLKGGGN